MASIGKLIAAVAEAEGMDEGSVKLIARYAREAGYISQGTYGPGAAQMTATDAVNLLIAVNASDAAKSSSTSIPVFRRLRAYHSAALYEPGEDGQQAERYNKVGFRLATHINFGSLLEQLLHEHAPGTGSLRYLEDETLTTVTFSRPDPEASVYIRSDVSGVYFMNTYSRNANVIPEFTPNRTDKTTITGVVIRQVANAIFG